MNDDKQEIIPNIHGHDRKMTENQRTRTRITPLIIAIGEISTTIRLQKITTRINCTESVHSTRIRMRLPQRIHTTTTSSLTTKTTIYHALIDTSQSRKPEPGLRKYKSLLNRDVPLFKINISCKNRLVSTTMSFMSVWLD
jgi:hypothetical protein